MIFEYFVVYLYMTTYIYAIKNLVNNKVYIGSTKSPKNRKYEHFWRLKKNIHHSQHLQRSYNKYGKDFFSYYILEECDSNIRKEKEIFYINKFQSYKRDFGYNVYEPNEQNFTCSPETIEKIKNTEYIKSYKVALDLYDLNGNFIETFDSQTDCYKKFKIPISCISLILRGKRKKYRNFTVVRKGENFDYIPSKMQRNMSKFYKTE